MRYMSNTFARKVFIRWLLNNINLLQILIFAIIILISTYKFYISFLEY